MNTQTNPADVDAAAQLDAQTLAERVAEAMYARDRASQMLGMTIQAITPDHAKLVMTVREDMTNGHHICHGGLIFSLADSAFAFACNSGNQNTVSSGANIDHLRPAFVGDRLTAEAVVRSASGRTGVYDVTVTNQNNDLIALFRGKSHRIKGEVLAALDAE